jgi:hypothetical protein
MRTIHLGELLVQHGVLTAKQRDEVLIAQTARGGAFGALAEEMFGVPQSAVERAWAEQYAGFAPHIDPRRLNVNPRVLEVISKRQAWQFRVLPIADNHGQLTLCTTQDHLVRALKFAGWRLGHSCQFVLAEPLHLGEALVTHYPMAGMTPQTVIEGVSIAGLSGVSLAG